MKDRLHCLLNCPAFPNPIYAERFVYKEGSPEQCKVMPDAKQLINDKLPASMHGKHLIAVTLAQQILDTDDALDRIFDKKFSIQHEGKTYEFIVSAFANLPVGFTKIQGTIFFYVTYGSQTKRDISLEYSFDDEKLKFKPVAVRILDAFQLIGFHSDSVGQVSNKLKEAIAARFDDLLGVNKKGDIVDLYKKIRKRCIEEDRKKEREKLQKKIEGEDILKRL
ncbi:hypothetical protein HYW82_04425 [Candidatus Peregrinibacteria bacterium]|nr:hypothetical protein [Candidatus Peregrinibacteria bacterium]